MTHPRIRPRPTHRIAAHIGDADLAARPDLIRRVGTSLPDGEPILVVPGHGEPGGRELLTHTIALLESAPRT